MILQSIDTLSCPAVFPSVSTVALLSDWAGSVGLSPWSSSRAVAVPSAYYAAWPACPPAVYRATSFALSQL